MLPYDLNPRMRSILPVQSGLPILKCLGASRCNIQALHSNPGFQTFRGIFHSFGVAESSILFS